MSASRPSPPVTLLLSALALSALTVLCIEATGLSRTLEHRILDAGFRLRPSPDSPSPVTVVALRCGKDVEAPHRSLREELAVFLAWLEAAPNRTPAAGKLPAAVAIDVVLSQPDLLTEEACEAAYILENLTRSPKTGGRRIVASSLGLGNVVHAFGLAWDGAEIKDPGPPPETFLAQLLPISEDLPHLPRANGLELAHASLAAALYDAPSRAGFFTPQTSEDEVVRRFPLLARLEEGVAPALSVAALARAVCPTTSLEDCLHVTHEHLVLEGHPPRVIPVAADGTLEMEINYRNRFAGPAGARAVPTLTPPDWLCFSSGTADQKGGLIDASGRSYPLSVLDGQIVLVSDWLEASPLTTPMGLRVPVSSVHAQIMANVLEQDFLTRPPPWTRFALSGLVLALVAFLRWKRGLEVPSAGRASLHRWHSRGLAWLEPLLGLAWLLVAWGVFAQKSIVMPVVLPVASLLAFRLGWQWSLPTVLRREVQRASVLIAERDTLLETLRTAALEQERAGKDAPVSSDDDASVSPAPTPSAEETTETLTTEMPVTPRHTPTVDEALVQARLKSIELMLRAMAPTLEAAQGWASERLEARTRPPEALRQTLREATATVRASSAGVPELTPLEPNPFVLEHTGCLTRDPVLVGTLREVVERLAPSELPVLIVGETGTGKELVARALHTHSSRCLKPFVARSCADLTPALLTDELFGHRRGAFTGASEARQGLFLEAHGGTLFLDEVGELPQEMQSVFLRVLETGEVRPLGGDVSAFRRVDVRVVAATHVDLEQRVREGRFRSDLYFRLKALVVRLPPLRERAGDTALLIRHFLAPSASTQSLQALSESKRPTSSPESTDVPIAIAPEALEMLVTGHDWLGNVRELKAVLEALKVTRRSATISADDVRRQLEVLRAEPGPTAPDLLEGFSARERELVVFQRRHEFSPTRCGQDPLYPGNRQTADRHQRVLLCRALCLEQFDVQAAARRVAGETSEASRERLIKRLNTLLENLRARLRLTGEGLELSREELASLSADLSREYRPDQAVVLEVVNALMASRVRFPS